MRQVIVTDLDFIRDCLKSTSVTSWGNGSIPDTDLYQLALCSPVHKGDKQTQFVCSLSDLAAARAI